MKKLTIALAVIVILFTGCEETDIKEEDLSEFMKLEWLNGIWEGTQGDAQIYESWRRKSPRIMEGISYTTIGEERVYSQDMRIEQSNNEIFFILKNNADEEIRLELNSISKDSIVFMNPDEGYPQKIVYTEENNNRMNVALFGAEGDDANKTEFSYRKTDEVSRK